MRWLTGGIRFFQCSLNQLTELFNLLSRYHELHLLVITYSELNPDQPRENIDIWGMRVITDLLGWSDLSAVLFVFGLE